MSFDWMQLETPPRRARRLLPLAPTPVLRVQAALNDAQDMIASLGWSASLTVLLLLFLITQNMANIGMWGYALLASYLVLFGFFTSRRPTGRDASALPIYRSGFAESLGPRSLVSTISWLFFFASFIAAFGLMFAGRSLGISDTANFLIVPFLLAFSQFISIFMGLRDLTEILAYARQQWSDAETSPEISVT